MGSFKTLERKIIRDDNGTVLPWEVSNPLRGEQTIYKCTARAGKWIPRSPVSTNLESLPDRTYQWKMPKHDPESFKKIRQSGVIKMTPYSVGNTVEKFPIVRIEGEEISFEGDWNCVDSKFGRTDTFVYGQPLDFRPGYPPYTRHYFPYPNPIFKYKDIKHSDFRSYGNFTKYDVRTWSRDLETVIESVKSEVATKLHQRWDALTDIAESRSTLQTALTLLKRVRHPLASAKVELERLRSIKATDKEIRSKWLEFWYGIMPIAYSAQDIAKMIAESQNKYLTERSRGNVSCANDLSLVPVANCRYLTHTGHIKVTGVAKARFSTPSARAFQTTSLNPFSTAWEIIPYSLVVDWFTNFGEWLYNQTSSMGFSTLQHSMCYSVKREVTTREYVRILAIDGSYKDYLIRETIEQSYNRDTFNQSDINLILDVKFSSWKRWFDAYALSVDPLVKALRRLT